jgi:hypothetical protein
MLTVNGDSDRWLMIALANRKKANRSMLGHSHISLVSELQIELY